MRLMSALMMVLLIAGCGQKEEPKAEVEQAEVAPVKDETKPDVASLKVAAKEFADKFNKVIPAAAKPKMNILVRYGNEESLEEFSTYGLSYSYRIAALDIKMNFSKKIKTDVGIVYSTVVDEILPEIKVKDIRKDDSSMLYSHTGYVTFSTKKRVRKGRALKENAFVFDDGNDISDAEQKRLDKMQDKIIAEAKRQHDADKGVLVGETNETVEAFYWHTEDKKWVSEK